MNEIEAYKKVGEDLIQRRNRLSTEFEALREIYASQIAEVNDLIDNLEKYTPVTVSNLERGEVQNQLTISKRFEHHPKTLKHAVIGILEDGKMYTIPQILQVFETEKLTFSNSTARSLRKRISDCLYLLVIDEIIEVVSKENNINHYKIRKKGGLFQK